MFSSKQHLLILDADGTTVDAWSAIEKTFSLHGMSLGDEESFQKRRRLLKYLGGIKDLPGNLRHMMRKRRREQIVDTLTEVYREEATLYPGMADFVRSLIETDQVRVGLVTRNITREPLETLRRLFARHDVNTAELDFFVHCPLAETKTNAFRAVRKQFDINPACSYACGDEHKDWLAATACGMHPFMVSYGFEDFHRLIDKYDIPADIIARSPEELRLRVTHALLP